MRPIIAILSLIFIPLVSCANDKWTHHAEEGEDATSTHYYFYESNGDSVQRVRWVWNGGAQNQPTITEFIFGSGKITVRNLVGKREDIQDLISGRDSHLVVENEYSIIVSSTAERLIPPLPADSLSESQRIDLKNLIDLLAKNRKPILRDSTKRP